MAGHRTLSNGTHEFIVKRAKLLPEPIRLYFDNYDEGALYCARLEKLLDSGIVPEEFKAEPEYTFIGDVIRRYMQIVAVKHDDKNLLNILHKRVGAKPLREVNYQWVESWVMSMKRIDNLAPGTIRHYVGALGRCFDWGSRKGIATLVINPVRLLPRTYSQYNEHDITEARKNGGDVRTDIERDRRLDTGEEVRIREFLHHNLKPEGKERPLKLDRQGSLILIYELALETAMRLREIYTLTVDQVDVPRKTIFLDRTKNGHKRQVPMSSRAIAAYEQYRRWVVSGEMKMTAYDLEDHGRLIPHWSGDLDQRYLHKVSTGLSHQFKRVFAGAGSTDLGIHDLRHEATSRLFERTTLSDAQIMKITGHKSTEILLRYANLRASNLADYLG